MRASFRFGLSALSAIAASAGAQNPVASQPASLPFVEIAIRGPDIIYAPEQIRYRVSADPGTYVTVFRVTPQGAIRLIRPVDGMLKGTGRTDILRETRSGFTPGIGYLVAVATRDSSARRRLIARTESNFRLTTGFLGAEAALDNLLDAVIPGAGNDLATAFVSYRVVQSSYSEAFSDYTFCPFTLGDAIRRAVFLQSAAFYVGAGIFDRSYTNSLIGPYLEPLCFGNDRRPFLLGSPIASTPSAPVTDTGVVRKIAPPQFRQPEPPVTLPGREGQPGAPSASFFHPTPIVTEPRAVEPPRTFEPPRSLPVAPVVREPVSQPVVREYSPPPPPPPPPPTASPPQGTRSSPKPVEGGTIPPASF